jgi:membrane protease subunit HflC
MRIGAIGTGILAVLALGAFLLWNATFIVTVTQQALVLRFGQIVQTALDPGLYFKVPFVDNVVMLEKRILEITVPRQGQVLEVITVSEQVEDLPSPVGPPAPDAGAAADPAAPAPAAPANTETNRLAVDAFARYRIDNPLLFFQSLGSQFAAESQLNTIINSAVRRVLSGARLSEIVATRRAQLMQEITRQVDTEARRLGIRVVDVRLSRADLPQAISSSVFERMRARFIEQATRIRSEGRQQAQQIRAAAERDAQIIQARGQQRADELRGEGEARRSAIFAEQFSRDPEFFEFYRRLQAIENGLIGGQTRLVISPDSDFFRTLNDPSTAARRNAAPPATGTAQP